MQLTLLIPGLILPDAVRDDTVFDLDAPALSLILGRGQRHVGEADWLAAAFGLPSPLPVAALRKVGAGGTADGSELCLDPVHWRVAREGVTLADPQALRLEDEESAALLAAIQPLLAPWGTLAASSAAHWELCLERSLLLETQPLPAAIGLPIDPALPGGLDGPTWRRLLAEIQTVLHAHPVNTRREALGRPTVNSLWPWGLGSLPAATRTDFTRAWSDAPLVAGLCALAGIPCQMPPPRFQTAAGNVLCTLDWLAHAAYALDALAWRQALQRLEQDWLAPALAAMKRGECEALRLVGVGILGETRTATFSLVRGNLWRFWRRPLPLSALYVGV